MNPHQVEKAEAGDHERRETLVRAVAVLRHVPLIRPRAHGEEEGGGTRVNPGVHVHAPRRLHRRPVSVLYANM